jgi:Ca2+-binding RTX toxin-like protein
VDYRVSGSIGLAGEVDKVVVAMVPGTTYTFQMLGVSSLTTYTLGQLGLGSLGQPSALLGDSSIKLTSASGALVGSDDDSGIGLDSTLSFTDTAAGNYTLALSGVGSLTGNYVMTATVSGAAMQAANTYTVNSSSTLVIEGAGGVGQDVVLASVSYALASGSEIELLRTTNDNGKTSINLTGNEFAQTIFGNAGANIIEGKGGSDTLYGGKGNDTFVLSGDALASAANVDHIMDYSVGETVDLSQVLKVVSGVNVLGGGFLRVTSSGLVQVDLDGGSNNWVTLSTVNGTAAVTMRYLSGGTATTVLVSRTADSALAPTSASQHLATDGSDSTAKSGAGLQPVVHLQDDWPGTHAFGLSPFHSFNADPADILSFL